jgi:diguanylate cyclase (GGDEF)-like protein
VARPHPRGGRAPEARTASGRDLRKRCVTHRPSGSSFLKARDVPSDHILANNIDLESTEGMPPAPLPENESERLRSLRALNLLDTPPEERFDRLTRVARRLFDAPIALMSLVDEDRQWFKSRPGLDFPQTPRDHSFCAHAILDEGAFIVPDALADERFSNNPLVRTFPEIRFYAGYPVRGPDGSALGTLCVIDHEPRDIEEEDVDALRDLAGLAEQEIKSLSLATSDDLTHLTNRRGFEAIASHTLALCHRVHRPATLLLFDLDDFKLVNDARGHGAGDRVLKDFADHLLATFRDSDVVARIGGDEFCVLLSGATTRDIPRPIALLRSRRNEAGEPIHPFSVGAAAYDAERHTTVADLVAEADAEMYKEKDRRQAEGLRGANRYRH